MQCPVTDYAADMTSPVRRTTQHTIGVDDELWSDCQAIARVRRQRMSEIARAAYVAYREENRALLDEIKRSETFNGIKRNTD